MNGVCCHCGQETQQQQPEWEPAHGAGAAHRADLDVRTPWHGLMVSVAEVGLALMVMV